MKQQHVFALTFGVVVAVVFAAVAVALLTPDRRGPSFAFAPCDLRGVEMYCVDLDSGAVAVVTQQPSPETSRLIVFDPGGPGVDLRSSVTTLSSLAADQTLAVAFIEPWTMSGISESCSDSADAYLAHMRDARPYRLPQKSIDLSVDCPKEMASAKAFAHERSAVLRDVVDRAPDVQVKYLGWSFATHRLASLTGRFPVDSALIISPIRHDQYWHEILGERSERSSELLQSVGVSDFGLGREPLEIDGRSTPLTPFDAAAASYAAVYDIQANQQWLLPAVNAYQDNRSDSPTLDQFSSAADSILGRYGVNSIYPGIVGYWAEFCDLTGSKDDETLVVNDQISWFLYSFHQPCQGEGSDKVPSERTIEVDNVCLVVGQLDPLATGVGTKGWIERPSILEFPDAGHFLTPQRSDIADIIAKFTTTDGTTCEM